MASQGLFSIGGIASGLDTSSIIEQLLALERQPVKRLEQQQADLGAVKDAWGKVTTKLSTLRSAVDGISRLDRFDAFMSTTSSDPDAVAVSATGATDTGTLSFTVERLAARMQSSSADVFAAPDAALDGRTLVIEDADGVSHDLTAGLGAEATLDDLIAAVNDADIGVRASALQVSSGDYQLVLDAQETGLDNDFVVDAAGTTGWTNAFATTQNAEDAWLKVGGIDVVRSSNTIKDLVDGATITLRQTTTQSVTVTSERDVDGAVKAVKDLVAGLQGVFSTIDELTAYDPDSGQAGALQGEMAARELRTSLRDALSRPIPGLEGTDSLASTLGISFDRDGSLQFDEDALRQAFTDDFDGTAARLARSGSTTDAAGAFLGASSAATPGTYEVDVSRAADVARIVGAGFAPVGATEPKTFRITGPGGETVRVTITSSETTVTAAVSKINKALAEAGQDDELVASESGGEIQLASTRYGSSASFTVEEIDADTGEPIVGGTVWGLEGTHTGVDVEGTIGGEAATGVGQTLTGDGGDVDGLAVSVDGLPAAFDVTWTRGMVGELSSALSRAEGITGSVARARQSIDSQVEIYQDRIESFERRLETREATIRQQFVAMETMLGRLNQQGNWLGQQLAGLNGSTQQ